MGPQLVGEDKRGKSGQGKNGAEFREAEG